MKLAIKIHKCLKNGANSHELLDVINKIKDKNMLAEINEYFMQHYDETPYEVIGEKYKVDEVYAIDSAFKCIRKPEKKNFKARKKFYAKIGYKSPKK